MRKCYFDHAATNPLDKRVFDAMTPYFIENFGNPLSLYDLGTKAKEAIENARTQVAALINSKSSEIIFTASGAEANNFALRGIALARQNEGKHVIVSKMEHHSILNSARFLEKMGFVVTFLPVDKYGIVDPDTVKKSITKETTLISITHASSEVGTIEPIKEIGRIAKGKGIIFHTDAVAAAGNIPVDVKELGVDLLSMAAHQFYGPKGAGALYVREGMRIVPLIYGGIQENGRRAGTENVPAIVGMGKAAELAKNEMVDRIEQAKKLRDKLIKGVSSIENIYLTGHPENRLPAHASFTVEFIEGEAMLLLLAAKGIYAASGSACSSKALKSSPVLLSMGVSSNLAQGSIVFTLGTGNTEEDIDYLLSELPQVIKRLREMSPYAKGWGTKGESGECTVQK
ncbi:MAG: cysteine desulfurase NifS [Nitrospirae bacterium GWF2_44_13]|nr:MAG: cysteine desulfurase NifS [Nitrospirae bacterium GWF2_44_13]OGW34919.1 MAG: cysteine desulfurase NifS [Nitrospirae bacterium GWD2_44_7]OGW66237.1 MAG: cysteine desulfurase NifS [Nitrospirae bacterium RIFOXYA2_FULL_44_9]OGW74496.1 MAG: cysteine desulfurase NifS [Nitrospirae bacterium RIFOXYC2_FULL_44_7]HBG92302.1 cysteine desulfurase NifS [Nitrospiraceae bacterium]